jgi:hypothetical protein
MMYRSMYGAKTLVEKHSKEGGLEPGWSWRAVVPIHENGEMFQSLFPSLQHGHWRVA